MAVLHDHVIVPKSRNMVLRCTLQGAISNTALRLEETVLHLMSALRPALACHWHWHGVCPRASICYSDLCCPLHFVR